MNKSTKQISVTINIDAPQKVVFDIVTNWDDQEKWVFLTKVRGVGNDSRREGGKLEAFTGIGNLGFLDTMTITAWEYPGLCEVTHTGNIVKGKGVFEVSIKDSSTYFTWTEYVELPFGVVGRMGWILVRPFVKITVGLSLRRLKKLIEKITN